MNSSSTSDKGVLTKVKSVSLLPFNFCHDKHGNGRGFRGKVSAAYWSIIFNKHQCQERQMTKWGNNPNAHWQKNGQHLACLCNGIQYRQDNNKT